MVQPVRPWANPTRTGPRRDVPAWWSPPADADRAAWLAACTEVEAASPDVDGDAPRFASYAEASAALGVRTRHPPPPGPLRLVR
jgi:hypothetical protein